ncbi:ABC transporter substrate-binding protein [Castellaniella sp. GW247-6E4]|uniref:ABC transporter substrate-binding protein n=1 Tax=Castellaniella sp. GW247-6E4 TaxID=3140380 RepID=UPI00331477C0
MKIRAVLSGAALLAAFCAPAVSSAADTIKIGTLFPMSGPMALLGNEAFQAAEVAREMVNESGGVLGKTVEFATADAPDPTSANAEATRLIIREKVPVITGSYSSAIALAASEVAEREGVLYWETVAVADKFTERKYNNIVRLTFNASMMGITAAKYAQELSGRLGKDAKDLRVGIISEDSEFGQSVGDAAAAEVKKLGMQLVANEHYSKTVTDLSSLVLSLKAKQPDVVIATSYLNDGILFWRQARELDLPLGAMIGIGTGYALPDFLKATGDYANGIFDVDAPSSLNVSALPQDTQALYHTFTERFEAKTNRKPGPLAYISFGGYWTLFKHVIPAAGSMDSAALRKAAAGLDLPMGALLTGAGVKLNAAGQNERALISVMQWQDKQLEVVWPQNIAVKESVMVPLPAWDKR